MAVKRGGEGARRKGNGADRSVEFANELDPPKVERGNILVRRSWEKFVGLDDRNRRSIER